MPVSKGSTTKERENEQAQAISAMYANQAGVNFGKGLADPFVSVLAIDLGATAPQLGWLNAFTNLFPAVMQVPWGKLSDFFGRRVPFLVIGGVISFILYFFMVGSVDPWQLIFLVSVQLAVGSMMIPTWYALVGDRTTPASRGYVMSRFFVVSSLASIIATLIGGAIASDVKSSSTLAKYSIPFFMAGISGILGSIAIMRVNEEKRRLHASPKRIFAFGMKSFIFTSELKENPHFRDLVILNSSFNFLMSIIWPILYITYVKVLDASLWQIAVMTVISTGSTILFQLKVGRLLDLIGPIPQILISRVAYISVPIVFALATSVWHIYVINAALGFANAMANVAFFKYILDVAPEEKKGEYFAVYNTVIGLATFAGCVIGGYLAAFFMDWLVPAIEGSEAYVDQLILALGAVYAISAFGRAAGAIWFIKLKDPVKYPETLMSVTRKTLKRWKKNIFSPS